MKKYQPLVSIIVPSYNHEMFVEECIESIASQTYANIELIVIDDGSTDNSPIILQRLQKKYQFFYLHQQNMGVPATLNNGIALAHGKYIAECASDDFMAHDRIEKQARFMELNSNLGFCYGQFGIVDQTSHVLENRPPFNNIKGDVFRKLLLSNFIPACTVMIRKEVFDDVGLYDENIPIEDWYMWLKISKKYQIDYMDDVISFYRLHGSNYSGNYSRMLKYELKTLALWKSEGPLYYLAVVNAFKRYVKSNLKKRFSAT